MYYMSVWEKGFAEELDKARRAGWTDAIKALRDRRAATVVGRLLARTNGDANGIQIAAELADHLEAIAAHIIESDEPTTQDGNNGTE